MNPLLVPLGSDLAKIARQAPAGAVLQLVSGVWPGACLAGRTQSLTLQGDPNGGTVFTASGIGLRLEGCRGILLADLVFRHCGSHGSQAVNCTGIHYLRCEADGNGTSAQGNGNGLETGGSSQVLWEDCYLHDHLRGHGGYFSEQGSDNEARGCRCVQSSHCGLQANGHPSGGRPGIQERLKITGCTLTGNANAGLQLAAVHGAVIAGNDVTGNRVGVVAWDDASGPKWGCRDIDLAGQPSPWYVITLDSRVGLKLPPGAVVRES